jgi:hypothetical protein
MQPAHLLTYAVKQQIESDQRDCARELIRFVLDERPALRVLDRILRRNKANAIPVVFALANGLRCFTRLHASSGTGGALACGLRPNERRALDEVRALVPDLAWDDVQFDLKRAPASLSLELFRDAKRMMRIARRLQEDTDLVAWLRAIELIGYYARLGQLLTQGRHRVAVLSTYTNPWGIALNIAARRRNIPVVLVTHGSPVGKITRLDYDVAIVDSHVSAAAFREAGCRIGSTIVRSVQSKYRVMKPDGASPLTVGVFLSKYPAPAVRSWIDHLLQRREVARIVVRAHPANPAPNVLRELARYSRVEVSTAATCLADLHRCDVAIAGNSSVHLESVTAGTPTVFVPALDGDALDSYGFANSGLVLTVAKPDELSLPALHRFYAASGWTDVLRTYVEVERSEDDIARDIREAFRRVAA